jgi:excisionase family DNA binding protein
MTHTTPGTLPDREWITAKDIADHLGISLYSARELIKKIPFYRIGRLIRVRKEDFVKYLRSTQQNRPTQAAWRK